MPLHAISVFSPLSNYWPTWNWNHVRVAPSNAASNAPACSRRPVVFGRQIEDDSVDRCRCRQEPGVGVISRARRFPVIRLKDLLHQVALFGNLFGEGSR